MARPTKQGVDYFPLDCQFDNKIEMYLIEKESTGLAVLISIWQIIYSNEGYYIENNEDLLLLVKKRVNIGINEVNSCINKCLDRGIFNNELYEKFNILTSKAIQKRYFDITRKREAVRYTVDYIINGVKVGKNGVKVGRNYTKESKVKESKGKNKKTIVISKSKLPDPETKPKVDNSEIYKQMFDIWNSFAVETGLSKIKLITKTRKAHILARLKEKEFNFIEILECAKKQSFCLGENKKGWTIDFDWLVESPNNYIKVLENKYIASFLNNSGSSSYGKQQLSQEQREKLRKAREDLFKNDNQ